MPDNDAIRRQVRALLQNVDSDGLAELAEKVHRLSAITDSDEDLARLLGDSDKDLVALLEARLQLISDLIDQIGGD